MAWGRDATVGGEAPLRFDPCAGLHSQQQPPPSAFAQQAAFFVRTPWTPTQAT